MTKKRATYKPSVPDFNLGGQQAEADPLLQSAFYESRQYSVVSSRTDPRCFIVGRTGSGKSAILTRLEEEQSQHVVRINPEDLSLPYISDLSVMKFLASMDVHLDPFFIALWKHVLLIEIIKHRYKVNSPAAKQRFLTILRETVSKDRSKAAALDYLEEFEGKFWCETDERVRDITKKFEEEVNNQAGGKLSVPPLAANAQTGTGTTYSEETKAERSERFQRIVNETQLPRLNKMIQVLNDDILDSPQNFAYVIIDDLDRDWVDERILNSLIRCLFRAVLDLQKVRHLKALVALRTNIFSQLDFGSTGGQEEKFRAVKIDMRWSDADLKGMLDARTIVAGEAIGSSSVREVAGLLPSSNRNRGNPLSYMLTRTLMRPRDIIAYFNECLQLSGGKPKITWEIIHEAEYNYSSNRLLALRDEWKPSYPDIDRVLRLFEGAPSRIDRDKFIGYLGDAATLLGDPSFKGDSWMAELTVEIWKPYKDDDWARVYHPLARLLYDIGFIGCVHPHNSKKIYSCDEYDYLDRHNALSSLEHFSVHPTFRAALGISQ